MQYDQQQYGEYQTRPAPPRGDLLQARNASLQSIIRRIRECIELETRAISEAATFDAKESNARKSRLLFELGRASRDTDPASLDQQCLDDFAELRKALARNEAVLRAHVSAVSEVAGILQRAIEREETDGTYSTKGMMAAGI
ncbi:MAG: hypothetical protein R3D45_10850 [Rhizobiaceae bacterium]